MKRLHLVGAATVALILFGIGCSKNSASDDAIATGIKAKLYSDETTKPANINVAVKGGVVTLTGDVPTSDVELEAMKVANATAGVRSVNDQLKVSTAMAQLPDAGTPQGANPPAPQPSHLTSSASKSKPDASEPPPPPSEPTPAPAGSPAPPPSQSNPEPTPPPTPAPTGSPVPPAVHERPKPVELTVPTGTAIAVRTIDSIDSKTNQTGQTFRATLADPLMAGGTVAVPAGTPVSVLLSDANGAGRIKGSSSLEVRLASLEYHGRSYRLDTSEVTEAGKGRGKSTAVRTGIGAAAGAVIGALAGGGKGAAIGSAAGGGAGFGINALTHGSQVKIPSETVLQFTLQQPLTVTRHP